MAYYVINDDKCLFEGMTKEEILTAITQAVSTHTISDVDTGFITTIKEKNNNAPLSFWVGTTAEYNAISQKEQNTFYILTDDTDMDDLENAISQIIADIQNIDNNIQNISEIANEAYEDARAANNTANTAYTAAGVATNIANNASEGADEALEAAQVAQTTADEAQSASEAAQSIANAAQSSAQIAYGWATNAQNTATGAVTEVNKINTKNGDVLLNQSVPAGIVSGVTFGGTYQIKEYNVVSVDGILCKIEKQTPSSGQPTNAVIIGTGSVTNTVNNTLTIYDIYLAVNLVTNELDSNGSRAIKFTINGSSLSSVQMNNKSISKIVGVC